MCYRQSAICERVLFLSQCSSTDLIEELSRVYHKHKGKSCRILPSWQGLRSLSTSPLKTLQLAAICLGGKTLATICYAMCRNYKQLSSGAPDLLLVRVQLIASIKSTEEDGSETDNEGGNKKVLSVRVTIPLSFFLGDNWQDNASTSNRKRSRMQSAWDEENLLDTKSGEGEGNNSSSGKGRNSNKRRFSRMLARSSTMNTEDGESDQRRENANNNEREEEFTYEEVGEEELHLPNTSQELREIAEKFVNTVDGDVAERNVWKSILALCKKDSNDGNNEKVQWRWSFESMFVEVKGPTDHLAYKQLLWLKILSLTNNEAFNTDSNNKKAFVCHVKEK